MLALLPSEAAANSGRGEGPFGAQLDNPCARRCQLQLLPPELLEALLGLLGAVDLVKLACGNKRFSSLILAAERLWKKLFVELYGEEATALRSLACKRAGGWRQLLGQKKIVDKSANGWERLCPAEMAALLETLCGGNLQHSVILLVDGSGSVQEDDFATMVTFIKEAADAFRQAAPAVKIGVVQFSNDVRVEVSPDAGLALEAFQSAVESMSRMNGGTNIALALAKAGQLLKAHTEEEGARTVVILTDGRVDSYQAKEAKQMVEKMADEQANVRVFGLGVGRGVDRPELLDIIAAGGPQGSGAEDRYVDLCVRDEAPW